MKNFLSYKLLPLLFASLFFISCQKEDEVSLVENEIQSNAKSSNFPEVISLPDGFNPEGIVSGSGNDLYAGSLFNGAIYLADRRTGEGSILVQGTQGRTAVGLDFDSRTGYIFVAGGPAGYAYVYDSNTGAEVAAIQLTTSVFPNTFINDVIVTEDAAYFTNSFQAEIYKISLDSTGNLSSPLSVQTISLTGDFTLVAGFNANGIVANEDGSKLIIANSTTGILYLTNAATGVTTAIDLGGATLPSADGLVIKGNKLYVVQNMFNHITVVMLNADWTSGTVIETITDSDFHIPTTATIKGNTIYVINAKFDIAPPPFIGQGYDPAIPFEIVAASLN